MVKVKVVFELDPKDWHGYPAETLWAELVSSRDERRFCLLNSPFHARGVNYLDVVEATPIEGTDLGFLFRDVVERGGHSTYINSAEPDERRLDAYWRLLERAGCSYESGTIDLSVGRRRLLAVDVPPSADLNEVHDILERGEHDKVWMFQEGHRHAAGSRPRGH